MASITIRNLDEATKTRLRIRAADLAQAIRARFRRLGGVELRLAAREPIQKPPKLGR